ncbi:MAG: MBL fold metallo-hydrolase [Promethearchaeota archaeon]|jgi:glyoxylase-like metal-dependent hydrolase (beta-lactamase superfamily II)
MPITETWYEVIKQKDYLYVIRERLDEIDPRFYSTYINLYLILGTHSALLLDTGSGLFPLKPIVDELVSKRTLLVVNTHSHFDHIGGNHEFKEIQIHNEEVEYVSRPFSVAFLKDSPKKIVKLYESINFTYHPAEQISSVQEGDIIDLGEISLRIIHTPGHSPGSISLLTNNDELFTGDTAHYGTMFLTKNNFPIFLSSLSKLIELFKNKPKIEVYPSHEEYPVTKRLLVDLYSGVKNMDNVWSTKVRDKFLEAWIVSDEKFKYAIF